MTVVSGEDKFISIYCLKPGILVFSLVFYKCPALLGIPDNLLFNYLYIIRVLIVNENFAARSVDLEYIIITLGFKYFETLIKVSFTA